MVILITSTSTTTTTTTRNNNHICNSNADKLSGAAPAPDGRQRVADKRRAVVACGPKKDNALNMGSS